MKTMQDCKSLCVFLCEILTVPLKLRIIIFDGIFTKYHRHNKIIELTAKAVRLVIKPSFATARAASCNGHVHLFVGLSLAKIQKRDFLKN